MDGCGSVRPAAVRVPHAVLVIGLAALWHARPRGRAYHMALTAAVIALRVVEHCADGAVRHRHDGPAAARAGESNAYNAFVRLPLETPSLIYRYLTDRESFYRPFKPEDIK